MPRLALLATAGLGARRLRQQERPQHRRSSGAAADRHADEAVRLEEARGRGGRQRRRDGVRSRQHQARAGRDQEKNAQGPRHLRRPGRDEPPACAARSRARAGPCARASRAARRRSTGGCPSSWAARERGPGHADVPVEVFSLIKLEQLAGSSPNSEVDFASLLEAGQVTKKKYDVVKVVGSAGDVAVPAGLTVKAHAFTGSARAAIEGAGDLWGVASSKSTTQEPVLTWRGELGDLRAHLAASTA